MFLNGDRSGAVAVLNRGDLSASRAINPWHDPIGDRRFVSDLIDQLRASAGLPVGATVVRSSAPASSTAGTVLDESKAPAPAVSTSPAPAGRLPQFSSSTTSVMVDVAVFDGKTPVTGLTPDDFEILDDGVPQTIAARGVGSVPLDVTVVLEFNDPVLHGSSDFPKRQGLLDTQRFAQSLTANDRIRLLVASSAGPAEVVSMRLARGVASWRDFTVAELVGLPTSSIFDTSAIALLTPVPSDRRGLVLLFTDGIDGASILTPAQVLNIARVADAAVYSARRYTTGESVRQSSTTSSAPPTAARSIRPKVNPWLTPSPKC
jgi:hypothetical protein